jgi:hypothetical protein
LEYMTFLKTEQLNGNVLTVNANGIEIS